jgi:hypothetical protein
MTDSTPHADSWRSLPRRWRRFHLRVVADELYDPSPDAEREVIELPDRAQGQGCRKTDGTSGLAVNEG